MENSLKQRIIGAIVLAALAVIFLPSILKEKSSNGTFVSKIPEKPSSLKEYRIDKEKINHLVEESEVVEKSERLRRKQLAAAKIQSSENEPNIDDKNNQSGSAKTPAKSIKDNFQAIGESAKTKTVEKGADSKKTQKKSKFTDSAWVIQVASFSKENNAINMVNKLKKDDFKAYRRKVVTEADAVYRVFVGPYIKKTAAEKAVFRINKISEGKALIKRFNAKLH